MGFGFNLFFIFILVPLSGGLLLIWLLSRKMIFGKLLGLIWLGIVVLICLVAFLQIFTTKMKVDKSDIYGKYVIDRSKFSGKQADWQYNHFRFEITKQNKLIFYQTEEGVILERESLKVDFLEQYHNDRLLISGDTKRHHIFSDNPTLYRNIWSFYYVFESPKFGNVFFKKGRWKSVKTSN